LADAAGTASTLRHSGVFLERKLAMTHKARTTTWKPCDNLTKLLSDKLILRSLRHHLNTGSNKVIPLSHRSIFVLTRPLTKPVSIALFTFRLIKEGYRPN
jgi:uncharacterized protein YaaW (UPF0174 family)